MFVYVNGPSSPIMHVQCSGLVIGPVIGEDSVSHLHNYIDIVESNLGLIVVPHSPLPMMNVRGLPRGAD